MWEGEFLPYLYKEGRKERREGGRKGGREEEREGGRAQSPLLRGN